jgi:ribosomal protein S27AE
MEFRLTNGETIKRENLRCPACGKLMECCERSIDAPIPDDICLKGIIGYVIKREYCTINHLTFECPNQCGVKLTFETDKYRINDR